MKWPFLSRLMRVLRSLAVFALTFLRALVAIGAENIAAPAAAAMEAAVQLVEAKRYPEAQAALEKIVADHPRHAAACHRLGMVIRLRNDAAADEEALMWLARAVELEPNNAVFLGDFGGASLQFADRARSWAAATRGRDAMEKAIALDPDYLEAREGLFLFYQRAPWPLGNRAKAAAQLAEIGQRNPDLATVLGVVAKTNARDYAAAFQLCDTVLANKPDNYAALYYYGRTASIAGQNLDRGLACLQRCLALEPPTPASPSKSEVWLRIGSIQEHRTRIDDALAAYRSALELDPGHAKAAEALARLREPAKQ